MIERKTPAQLTIMAEGGRHLAEVRDALMRAAQPGVTTMELEHLSEKLIAEHGATSNFKGQYDYPYTILTSVNEQVIHGKPNNRALQSGDLLSIDVGLLWKGWHLDTTGTLLVGGEEAADETTRLFWRDGYRILDEAIAQAVIGNRVGDISAAMQRGIESAGYSAVREYVGHGLGTELHMEPMIPCVGRPHTGAELAEGMTLAIEVMMNRGKSAVRTLKDGWTVVTKDGSLSGQFEHTVAVTKKGPKILTK
jgi:methionyl aminopeptidase